MLKGMLVTALRNANGDCTNSGVTSHHSSLYLIGPGVPKVVEVPKHAPNILRLDTIRGRKVAKPRPPASKLGVRGGAWMMGGNFIWSSDSRFPSSAPIPVHDRFETPVQIHALSH